MDAIDELLLVEAPPPADTGPLPVSAIPATGPLDEPASDRVGATTAAPTVGRPGAAVRTSDFPEQIVALPHGTPALANIALLDEPRVLAAPTTLTITVALAADATAAVLQMTWDGIHYYALNGGQAITAGAWYEESKTVPRGAQLNFRFTAATTLGHFVVHGIT